MSLKSIEKGIEACRSGAFEKGVEYFSEALEKDATNIDALYNRARALSKTGQLVKSLNDFKIITEILPSNASYIGDYAVSLHLNNKNDEAAQQFELALSLEPTNPYRYSSRAFFKDRTGDLEGAIIDYEKAVELDPEDAIALNNKGLVEEKLGYQDKAKQSFSKSNDLVGYKPDQKEVESKEPVTSMQEPVNQQSHATVIKSIFTKEGFKEFTKFSVDLVKGKFKKK